MRYIALPTLTTFAQDEDDYSPVYVPTSDKPWMVWDYALGEPQEYCDTEDEARESARILSEIDEREWQEKEWGDR